jgi:alkanesulfonate monooxygenase SsuD/methylene tetrahydromethanopterin reductase-like flavin-dependent oxidoreductase (luciferase family)
MKFDVFYQLPAARTQKPAERYRELIDEAIAVDRLGFDTVWLAEVHFAPRFSVMPTPLLLLAAIAERTTRLRLGMAVNLMPLHHPMRLAEEVATLDVLSGGRVEFGGGRGAFPLNYRGYGVGRRPVARCSPRVSISSSVHGRRIESLFMASISMSMASK